MAEETIFSKIIRREIPSDIVYQDDLVTAFRDISPQAPTHILIIPNILIPTVNDVSAEHEQALGRMITVAAKIAERFTTSICTCWVAVRWDQCWRIKVCNDEKRMLWAGVSGVVSAGGLSFTSGNSGE